MQPWIFKCIYDVTCLFPCLVAISASSPLRYIHVLVLYYNWGVCFLIVELEESSWILDDGLCLLQTVLAALELIFSFSSHCFSSSQLFFFMDLAFNIVLLKSLLSHPRFLLCKLIGVFILILGYYLFWDNFHEDLFLDTFENENSRF